MPESNDPNDSAFVKLLRAVLETAAAFGRVTREIALRPHRRVHGGALRERFGHALAYLILASAIARAGVVLWRAARQAIAVDVHGLISTFASPTTLFVGALLSILVAYVVAALLWWIDGRTQPLYDKFASVAFATGFLLVTYTIAILVVLAAHRLFPLFFAVPVVALYGIGVSVVAAVTNHAATSAKRRTVVGIAAGAGIIGVAIATLAGAGLFEEYPPPPPPPALHASAGESPIAELTMFTIPKIDFRDDEGRALLHEQYTFTELQLGYYGELSFVVIVKNDTNDAVQISPSGHRFYFTEIGDEFGTSPEFPVPWASFDATLDGRSPNDLLLLPRDAVQQVRLRTKLSPEMLTQLRREQGESATIRVQIRGTEVLSKTSRDAVTDLTWEVAKPAVMTAPELTLPTLTRFTIGDALGFRDRTSFDYPQGFYLYIRRAPDTPDSLWLHAHRSTRPPLRITSVTPIVDAVPLPGRPLDCKVETLKLDNAAVHIDEEWEQCDTQLRLADLPTLQRIIASTVTRLAFTGQHGTASRQLTREEHAAMRHVLDAYIEANGQWD